MKTTNTSRFIVSFNKFQELIGLLFIPNDPLIVNVLEEVRSTSLSDRKKIDLQINTLKNLVADSNHSNIQAEFFYVFLMHTYNISFFSGKHRHLTRAIQSAKKAIRYTRSSITKDYNRMLLHLYLGKLYCNLNKKSDSHDQTKKAQEILNSIHRLYIRSGNIDKSSIRKIEKEIDTDLMNVHWVGRSQQSTPIRDIFPIIESNEDVQDNESTNDRKKTVTTITIPVDIESIKEDDCSPEPLNSRQLNRLKRYLEKLNENNK